MSTVSKGIGRHPSQVSARADLRHLARRFYSHRDTYLQVAQLELPSGVPIEYRKTVHHASLRSLGWHNVAKVDSPTKAIQRLPLSDEDGLSYLYNAVANDFGYIVFDGQAAAYDRFAQLAEAVMPSIARLDFDHGGLPPLWPLVPDEHCDAFQLAYLILHHAKIGTSTLIGKHALRYMEIVDEVPSTDPLLDSALGDTTVYVSGLRIRSFDDAGDSARLHRSYSVPLTEDRETATKIAAEIGPALARMHSVTVIAKPNLFEATSIVLDMMAEIATAQVQQWAVGQGEPPAPRLAVEAAPLTHPAAIAAYDHYCSVPPHRAVRTADLLAHLARKGHNVSESFYNDKLRPQLEARGLRKVRRGWWEIPESARPRSPKKSA